MLSKYFGSEDRVATVASPTPATRSMDLGEDLDNWSQWSIGDAPVRRVVQVAPEVEMDFDKTAPAPVSSAPYKPAPASKGPTREQRREEALSVVDQHHHRVANTIRTLWGHKECSLYINKMLMSGGDGMGQNRVGFRPEAVEAMLTLVDLHDAEYFPN